MPKKSYSMEQIVTPLRQIEVSMARGKPYSGGLPRCEHIAAELLEELRNGEIFYSLKKETDRHRAIAQWVAFASISARA